MRGGNYKNTQKVEVSWSIHSLSMNFESYGTFLSQRKVGKTIRWQGKVAKFKQFPSGFNKVFWILNLKGELENKLHLIRCVLSYQIYRRMLLLQFTKARACYTRFPLHPGINVELHCMIRTLMVQIQWASRDKA